MKTLEGPFDLVRGMIVADNMPWFGLPFNRSATDAETDGVRAFVEHVRSDPERATSVSPWDPGSC